MFYTYGFKPINIKQRGVNFNLKKIGGVENEYIRVSNNITNIIKYNDELHRFDNCTNKKHKKVIAPTLTKFCAITLKLT